MYTFKYEDNNVSIEVKPKEHVVQLDELLKTFEDFLRAVGFNWIDSIEHVEESKSSQIGIQFTNEDINEEHITSARGNEVE